MPLTSEVYGQWIVQGRQRGQTRSFIATKIVLSLSWLGK